MASIAGPSRDNGGSAVFKDSDVQLEKIQHGRSKAVAARALKRGQTILDGPPAAVVPLPDSERCHRCLRAQVNVGCQNCGAEGYCSVNCRDHALKEYHSVLCPALSRIHQSARQRRWSPDTTANALLLANVVARGNGAIELVLDLLPAPERDTMTDEICAVVADATSYPQQTLMSILDRFRNNNHQLETEALYPAAVAVLPRISRACNHSCAPTGVICTQWRDRLGLTVGVRLLRDLQAGDEVTIPYLDPVQELSKRRKTLASVYGFNCACQRCIFQEANPAPRSLSRDTVDSLAKASPDFLHAVFCAPSPGVLCFNPQSPLFDSLPARLRQHIHPDNVSHVSKSVKYFATVNHWGNAASASMYLCAMYAVLYGGTWPLLGTQLVATASYFLNDCLSKPAEKSDMQSLLLAKSFTGMAEDCLGATVAEGGWLETGEQSTGPRETLFTVKASILSELEQLAK